MKANRNRNKIKNESLLFLSACCSWVFSRAVVKLASWKFLKFYRCPGSEKSSVVVVRSYQTVFCILKRKIKPLSLLQRREGTLLLKTEEQKTPLAALSAAISMADKHPHDTFLLYQKCLCLSPDSEQKGPTPSGSPLNQLMAHSFVIKKTLFFSL